MILTSLSLAPKALYLIYTPQMDFLQSRRTCNKDLNDYIFIVGNFCLIGLVQEEIQ